MSELKLSGMIVKALGGFYYVDLPHGQIECRAKGAFRKEKISPLVGDLVGVEMTDDNKGYIVEIHPRKNTLIRPPLANIDHLVLVVSTVDPLPNTLILDKLIAICEYKHIEPVIAMTKIDLKRADDIIEIYTKAGFNIYTLSTETHEGIDVFKASLGDGITVFTGNSGVGKSSLLNALDSRFSIKTAEISQKLGRGKHTTTHTQLYKITEYGYLADTPGFSTVEVDKFEIIMPDQLQHCFREFEPFIPNCQFRGCSHTCEKGCAVLEALDEEKINPSRHTSYVTMYADSKNIKHWEIR
ncbi:MAG: ribosome small subunit-dependent GTPase A [Oscillospiraceae bacterium]